MTSGDPDFLTRMRQEIEAMSQRLSVLPDAPEGYRGSDPAAAVTAVVDGAGMVTDVTVDKVWLDKIDSRQIGPAILAAVNAAQAVKISRWAAAVTDEGEKAADGGQRTSTPAEEPPAPMKVGPGPTPAVLDEMFTLLNDLQKEMRGFTSAMESLKTAKTKGTSAGGNVTVTLVQRQITGIDLDPRWIGRANHLEIASEVRSAIKAGYREAQAAAGNALETGAIGRVRALTSDPTELMRRLGLLAD